jgi:hypothetical protein
MTPGGIEYIKKCAVADVEPIMLVWNSRTVAILVDQIGYSINFEKCTTN